jgi:two-component system, OmpR family, sensor histidine kinase BaeS
LKQSLKTKLSFTILIIVLLTIAIISFFSNYFINRQFTDYIKRQQELKVQIIQSSLSRQYTDFTDHWNYEYIHAIGMNSLYEGYIIKVYDKNNNIIWDAQAHDMNLCNQIMNDISTQMSIKYPQINGKFTSTTYQLKHNKDVIGSVSISYFGPFFMNENEFKFLSSLNKILLFVGFISLFVSFLVGRAMARRISQPILKTVEATKEISNGQYKVRLEEESDTKELDMLVDSINHLAESLETLEKLRKQLTEDVAHELRTPITILQSYIEAMTEGIWEASPERLQSCYEEVLRIGKLVGDLEKLSKIESDSLKLNKQTIDLYEIIEKTVSSFAGDIENRKLEVQIHGDHILLLADQDRIRQVIVNLFTNAMKYSKDGCKISFDLFEQENMVGFHIQDSGIGIPPEELPYIFERFYRADKSRNRLTGGTGIGLTIVKAIVEAHGGKVTAESTLNEGSRFTVALPRK